MKTNAYPFEFAVGIECTFVVDEREDHNPPLRRLEEFELMRHYEMWREDFDLIAKLRSGDRRVTKVRWCFPWYLMEPSPGKFNFDWADQIVEYAENLDIDLVPDIVHYGTPEWLKDAFANPDYPERVAAFAATCAERYKGRIRHYTPLNEPGITCIFSALKGEWPPYFTDHKGFVRVLLQLADGIQRTVRAIKTIDPEAEVWAVEATSNYQPLNAEAIPAAKQALERDMICWDLVHGLVDDQHNCYGWLREGDVSSKQLERLLDNRVKMDLLGVNFYPWGSLTYEWKEGQIVQGVDFDGMRMLDLLRSLYSHTGANLFITETSAFGGGGARATSVIEKQPDIRIAWMDRTLEAVALARSEGLPVLGYTQFPLFTMVDWTYRLDTAPAQDFFINLGMIEVDPRTYERKWTPVAERFLLHLRSFEAIVKTS